MKRERVMFDENENEMEVELWWDGDPGSGGVVGSGIWWLVSSVCNPSSKDGLGDKLISHIHTFLQEKTILACIYGTECYCCLVYIGSPN